VKSHHRSPFGAVLDWALELALLKRRSAARASAAIAGVAVASALLFAPGCSGGCDDSKCASGNRCLDDGHGEACRLVCAEQATCPLNYACVPTPDGKTNFCAPLATKYAKKDSGQWGFHCNPAGGIDQNPDCDLSQDFWCYGETPTDADAFCTQYECTKDAECAGGYYCATVNNHPDVTTATPTHGKDAVRTVCLPRDYCAPCAADIDCPSTPDQPAHCVPGADGVKFCTHECTTNSNCLAAASCADSSAAGTKVCLPRAGVCKGDGSFCSPCRSDADCGDGFCIYENYTHERYCSVKSKVSCTSTGQKDCPAITGSEATVSCQPSPNDPAIPKDQCVGIIPFGVTGDQQNYIDGCWAVDHTGTR